jgi:2-polyprenyl-3-methyl-5-hydroxy-6-metoxy-1,4-benzoquinol methylase
MNSCYLCNTGNFTTRQGIVRDNPSLQIYECLNCGLVFLSSFDHITQNFYENSGMHDGSVDLDAWLKETSWDDERRFNSLRRDIENRNILDFGCGNGGFLAKARHFAKNAAGIEPDKSVIERFRKINIPVFSNVNDAPGSYDIITLFHVLEHLPDPRATLKKLANLLNNSGQIIVEVPNSSDALLSLFNCDSFTKFTYWSCHLFLFNQSTLKKLIDQTGLRLNYIKQVQRYPLSNHLYWLAKGQPGGHQHWSFLDSPELHCAYENQLASISACDTLLASFSVN